MAERAARGSWVEVHRVVLEPEERAPQVPPDTRSVPLEMKVKGFLAHDASVGEDAEIVTVAGRRLRGAVTALNPPYSHGFGPPLAPLSSIAGELRALLAEKRKTE